MKRILLLWSLFLGIVGYGQEEKLDIKTIIKEAEAGSAIAQYNLGMLYMLGAENFPQSATEAVKWWEKSAIQGQDLAQTRLGWAYEIWNRDYCFLFKGCRVVSKSINSGEQRSSRILGFLLYV